MFDWNEKISSVLARRKARLIFSVCFSSTGAARECYLSGGDFLDSSLYDNCDGTPRYAEKGFVQWLEDLQSQRAVLRAKIISGEFEVQEQVREA